ncbi:ABC transporter substrate-binding protein [Paenibacillus paeoniae]|uniref:Extracellular solute-binding protein n=1 Tax=Paenibacillus paeoniae TaxID=2292705 RepID=A0A371PIR9_9BACL|nr:extracellular solute-binding protein [Paenibacillus paeoniae]REK76112.1 extracellular solute-binding protein [Paenibacillus paeoniae]
MRKLAYWIPVLLMVTLLSQGCTTKGIGKQEQKSITLKIMGQTDLIERYKPMLEEKFPHIRYDIFDPMVKLNANKIPVAGWNEQIGKMIEEEEVDLYLNYTPNEYIQDFPVMDLAPLLDRDRIVLNEIQHILADSAIRKDGKLLQLSPTFNRDMLFINQKLFRDLGVPEPHSPLTWEEFRAVATSLQAKDANVNGYYMMNQPWMMPFFWTAEHIMGWKQIQDGQLQITGPEWRQLFEQLYEDIMEDAFENAGANPNRDPQQTAMYIAPAAYVYQMIGEQRSPEDWTIAELPRDPSHTQMTPFLDTNAFSIHADSSYAEDAWAIVSYLLSEEAAKRITEDAIAYGFVTYPELISIGDYPIEPIIDTNGTPWTPSSETLTDEANRSLMTSFQGNFEAVAKGSITFDAAWETIEKHVRELNANPESFAQ